MVFRFRRKAFKVQGFRSLPFKGWSFEVSVFSNCLNDFMDLLTGFLGSLFTCFLPVFACQAGPTKLSSLSPYKPNPKVWATSSRRTRPVLNQPACASGIRCFQSSVW